MYFINNVHHLYLFYAIFYTESYVTVVPDTWVQSDGMMHPKPEKNILGKVYSYFAGDEYKAFVKYNIIAATLLMPRWQGFTIVDASPDMNILSAIDGVFHVNTTMYPLFVGKGKTTHDKSQFKEVKRC